MAARLEMWPHQSMSYCKEDGGKAWLKQAIRRIHKLIGNTGPLDDYDVVITAGATQGLIGLISCFEDRNLWVYARAPFYFRFPYMAQNAGKGFFHSKDLKPLWGEKIEIVTWPSNPDNVRYPETEDAKHYIHDLCYNWPTYTRVEKASYDIMVFSLAKTTGHADTRVGWVLINRKKYPDLAKKLTWFTELTTGGVSCEAQYRAAAILDHQSDIIDFNIQGGRPYALADTVFDYGMMKLTERWGRIGPAKLLVKPYNSYGMFLWGKCEDPKALEAAGILYTPGPTCGGDDHEVRLNVGCSDEKFDEFMRRASTGG